MELLSVLARSGTRPAEMALLESGAVSRCMALMEAYPFNNLLHEQVRPLLLLELLLLSLILLPPFLLFLLLLLALLQMSLKLPLLLLLLLLLLLCCCKCH